ncbi:hypothetical protein [Streptomyces sp. NPDC004685]
MTDYDGMTNADVMSYAEMAERDRDDEYRLDAADEERARQAEPDLTPGDECGAEFIDGSWTYCGCEECEQREQDDAANE